MVVGNDIESALAPFSENLEMEPYKVIMKKDSIQRMAEHYKLVSEKEEFPTNRYKELLPHMNDWDGKPGYINEDGNIYTYSTYNTNSKWDWYQEGGRWGEMLLNYAGDNVNKCKKSDIDIETMKKNAGNKAGFEYLDVAHIFPNDVIPKIITWKEFISKVKAKEISIEEAREQYNDQEAVKLFKEGIKDNYCDSLDNYQISCDQFILNAQNKSIMTFAILYNGQWIEKGKMGWWACVSNEKDENTWIEEYNKVFESIPDDELITIVDCHI
jgi:hypothetical protein